MHLERRHPPQQQRRPPDATATATHRRCRRAAEDALDAEEETPPMSLAADAALQSGETALVSLMDRRAELRDLQRRLRSLLQDRANILATSSSSSQQQQLQPKAVPESSSPEEKDAEITARIDRRIRSLRRSVDDATSDLVSAEADMDRAVRIMRHHGLISDDAIAAVGVGVDALGFAALSNAIVDMRLTDPRDERNALILARAYQRSTGTPSIAELIQHISHEVFLEKLQIFGESIARSLPPSEPEEKGHAPSEPKEGEPEQQEQEQQAQSRDLIASLVTSPDIMSNVVLYLTLADAIPLFTAMPHLLAHFDTYESLVRQHLLQNDHIDQLDPKTTPLSSIPTSYLKVILTRRGLSHDLFPSYPRVFKHWPVPVRDHLWARTSRLPDFVDIDDATKSHDYDRVLSIGMRLLATHDQSELPPRFADSLLLTAATKTDDPSFLAGLLDMERRRDVKFSVSKSEAFHVASVTVHYRAIANVAVLLRHAEDHQVHVALEWAVGTANNRFARIFSQELARRDDESRAEEERTTRGAGNMMSNLRAMVEDLFGLRD